MSDLVGNLENRFSRIAAHVVDQSSEKMLQQFKYMYLMDSLLQ